jgi:hypothetical protein
MTSATIDGGAAVRIASLYAIAEICASQLGMAADKTPYQRLAMDFRSAAIRRLAAWSARIDLNADGKWELELRP